MPAYRRERWDTPDGDFIEADWVDGPSDAPLVVLFHGLEGSSRSHYARSLMRSVSQKKWRGIVPHFRGCGGSPNLLARAYHSGDSTEINWIIQRIASMTQSAPLFAAGVSLGGNALLKWLGESPDTARKLITGAAAVCPPLDLTVCGPVLGHGFNRIYTHHFLSTLKKKALEKLKHYPTLFDPVALHHARTLLAFDDIYTAPVHGYLGVQDYWKRASSKPMLRTIQVPTLLLLAQNDSFVPKTAHPTAHEISPCIQVEITRGGGHVGFTAPQSPQYEWLPQRLLTHFMNNC